jgi:hypothetical protein
MTDDQKVTTSDLVRSESDRDDDAGEREVPSQPQVGEEIQADQQPGGVQQPAAAQLDPDERPASDGVEVGSGDEGEDTDRKPLLPLDQTERFTERWREIQAGFVDRPRESVEEADGLVADLMQRLAASFSNERDRLEGQWDKGDDVSTEELRVVLTRYRSFFDRLLAA